MPYLRKLPSGLWQATVRHPSGKRITKTDPLRRVVNEWGRELEAGFARGDVRDPRSGRITVAEWYERRRAARSVDEVTREKTDSIWRTHCEPQWGTWPMDAITHMEAQEWSRRLERTPRARDRGRPAGDDAPLIAPATVHAAVHVMSGLYDAAVRDRPPIVLSNPFRDLELPTISPTAVDFYSHEEAEALVGELDANHGPQWAALVEVGLWVGLRPGEIFGLHGDRVGWLRHDLEVWRVLTRHGLRDHPKSARSHRVVPVPPWLMAKLSRLMEGRPLASPVFTAPKGGLVDDSDFRLRVWYPAIRAAGVRPFAPRIMRHTAASWLVMDGVDLYRVQALLGHESFRTTQRYAHLAPDAHTKIQESWRRMSDARARGKRKATGA